MIFRKGDRLSLDSMLIHMLETAEKLAGFEFEITSARRDEDPRSHGYGLAVDIACGGSRIRHLILSTVYRVGFRRVGIYSTHVHVDLDLSRDDRVTWLEPRRKQ